VVRPLLVAGSGANGGSNEVVAALLRHRPDGLASATCVVLEDGPMVERFGALGAEVRLVPSGDALALWKLPGVVRRLRAEIRRARADVVFAHGPKAHVYAALAARAEGVPYLWWQHDPPQLKVRRNRVVAKLPAALVICSSEFVAVEQRRRGRAPVVAVLCGTETDGVPGPRAHTAVEGALVGSVSRLQRYKGIERLVRAVPLVLEQRPQTRFRIVGGTQPGVDEEYEAELHALAAELGVADAIEWTGHVDNAASHMAELDILVHGATLEPFGLVLVEALLRGVPVVADREGGPAEIVRTGTDGLLVPVEDAAALADAVATLVGDPALRARMGASGRERVLERFDARRMAAETWEHVARVAAGTSAP
jgi:glycosyltransferase involved in cell wall biosynthesis